MDITTYVAAKKYTADSLIGLGALKGANCTVSKIEELEDGTSVTFMWTATDGTTQRSTMKVSNGVSIVGVTMNSDNTISCTLSDGNVVRSSGAIKVEPDKINYTTSKDSTIKSVGGALDKLFENGGGITEEPITANINIGNITSGTTFPAGTSLEDIVREMLTQYALPSVSMTINPSATLYDKVSGKIDALTIIASVTKKTSPIYKVTFYVNNAVVNTVTSGTENGGSFPYIYNTAITDDVTIKVVATDAEGGESTATKTIKFVGKSYYGIVSAEVGEPTESIIKTMNSTLKDTKRYVYSGITTDWGKVCYAYPSEFGVLSSIKDDVNNLNYTSSFAKTTATVDGITYNVYTQIDPSAATDVQITFA